MLATFCNELSNGKSLEHTLQCSPIANGSGRDPFRTGFTRMPLLVQLDESFYKYSRFLGARPIGLSLGAALRSLLFSCSVRTQAGKWAFKSVLLFCISYFNFLH